MWGSEETMYKEDSHKLKIFISYKIYRKEDPLK